MTRGRPATPLGTWGEVNFTETKHGKYQASTYLRLHSGKTVRIRATDTTKKKAETAIKIKCQERLKSEGNNSETLSTTSKTSELVDQWISQHKAAESTLKGYRSTINNHIKPALGNVRINEMNTFVIDSFLQSLSPAVSKQARAVLTQSFAMAVRYDLRPTNPVREARVVKPTNKKKARAVTATEFLAFRALAEFHQNSSPTKRLRAAPLLNIIDLLAATGARISELLSLKWEDVNLGSSPTVVIRPTKDHGVSTRHVELPSFAVDALNRQKTLSPPELMTFVFSTSTGTRIGTDKAELWFRETRANWHHWEGLEVPGEDKPIKPDLSWVTPHSFRRTMGTLIAAANGEYIASQQLGHADTATTRRHYIESPKTAQHVASLVDAYFQVSKK